MMSNGKYIFGISKLLEAISKIKEKENKKEEEKGFSK